ncbi:MAG TPA: GNAT family N-acetyltransferase [Pyrinomonadaceae bacterium]|nr:GNAT family N-acetyltransferase [Pyrinomonadaceae bacterium]
MTQLEIKVREGVHLSGIRLTDKPALLEHLHSKAIYNTTLNIPHPYTEADADWWIQKRIEHAKELGIEVSFAIRDAQDKLIGVVSADSLELGTTHRAEIGYWLALDYWGQGIMTDAVTAFVRYAFDELQLLRLTAHVFEFNVGSARVLEKNGFKLEGRLRKHIRKDGELLDGRLYGLLKEDLL